MGKHRGRRRNNRKGEPQQPLSRESAGKTKSGENSQQQSAQDDGTNSPSLAILQRIRHADPQTRLAALTALLHRPSTTMTTTSKSTSARSQHQLDLSLLQAVREQVMDSNLNVATTAAACLEEFVAQQEQQDKLDKKSDSMDLTTAGWYLLLLGRVQEAYQQTCLLSKTMSEESMAVTSSNGRCRNGEANLEKQEQWVTFGLTCLSTMTCLVQENPVVTERLGRTASLRRDSFLVLWNWVSYTIASTATDTNSRNNNSLTQQQRQLQEQATNLWHVLMEDNPNVVQPWYREEKAMAQSALRDVWRWVQQEPTTGDAKAPVSSCSHVLSSNLARLHLVGVLLAAFAQLPLLEDHENEERQLWSIGPLLVLLRSFLKLPEASTMDRPTLCQAHQQAQEQEQDSKLETAIVRQQSIKKEPARAIARRLKRLQQPQQTCENADGPMVESEIDEDNRAKPPLASVKLKQGALPIVRTDCVREWRRVRDDWRRHHVGLELALEMTANLTGGLGSSHGPMDDDDQRMMMQVEEGPLDADLRDVFAESRRPFQPFHELMNQLTNQLLLEWPPVIAQHLCDLQSKVAACLGHVVLVVVDHGLEGTHNHDDDTEMDGQEERRGVLPPRQESSSLLSAVSCLWRDLIQAFDKQPDVAGTLVVAFQSYSEALLSRNAIQPTDIDLFLKHLDRFSSSSSSNDQVDPNVCREWITLLGLLVCQVDHSKDVNYRVCQSLVKAGTTAGSDVSVVLVLAESLNVLMDIYGEDDRHPDVFQDLRVLEHFQKMLPLLKHNINLSRSHRPEEEVEYLKEIALNGSRFIQYKKGYS